jgi:hypothetical protein
MAFNEYIFCTLTKNPVGLEIHKGIASVTVFKE